MNNQNITKEVSDRICNHMNRDHSESVLKYVNYYAGIDSPKVAKMVEISSREMSIDVDGEIVKISFDHYLLDSKDAHMTLVKMIRETEK